jgi:2-amino-4-hydroxy-6-hydroxymethyldihydropteridine diphosphokinase
MMAIPRTRVVRLSSLYDTDPEGDLSEPVYLNAVACLDTELEADRLLWNLQLIESRLGREKGRRRGPRTIDLDLLFYDGLVIRGEGIEVPHPRMAERAFVLVPMAEIDPGWLDPRTGLRMDELLRERPHLERVRWAGRFML